MTNAIITFDIGADQIAKWPLLKAAGLAVARIPVTAQFAGADELLLAADGRLLSRVSSHMRLQIGALRETLAANLALKRLFARVDPQMRFQGGGLRETFAANMARKGPIARVNTKMIL